MTQRNLTRTLRHAATAVAATVAFGATASAATKVTVLKPGLAPQSGVQDDRSIQTDPAPRFKAMAELGASIVRVDLRWDQIATARPVNPTDPADPAYTWAAYDRVVDAAAANKIEVLFAVYGTPAWAVNTAVYNGDLKYGTHSIAPADATDFGRFAEAAARRYSPRGVTKWEGWNEPNIVLFLQPQYSRVGNQWVPQSPTIYSALLKEFSRGVKLVNPNAVIGGAVTAPAGDRCTSADPCASDVPPNRVVPMDFIRALNAPGLQPPMDVVSHHPYPLRAKAPASTPLGRTYSDLYNLGEMTRAIDATYLKGKRLWLTEYGFATAPVPEYKIVVSPEQQATNISDAYWRLRTNPRIAMGIYYFLQDHPGWRSGVLTQTGGKKPGYQAYAMPLHPVRSGRASVLFGQARVGTGATRVTLQRLKGKRWVTAKRLTTAGDGSYRVKVTTTEAVRMRAIWTGVSRSGVTVTRVSRIVRIPKG